MKTEWVMNLESSTHSEVLRNATVGLTGRRLNILHPFAFGHCARYPDFETELNGRCHPLHWIQGDNGRNGASTALQLIAAEQVVLHPVVIDETTVGHWYDDDNGRWCHLSRILPAQPGTDREAETQSVFNRMEKALHTCGLAFTDVYRTWLYLDRLLEWYDEFNRVRTDFFDSRGVFDRRVPASTGISGRNPYGAALCAAAMAVRPKDDHVRLTERPSPLQCPALQYRSSFSRAMEIEIADRRRLIVSGTASIDLDGATQHVNNPHKQIERTLDVVEALLNSSGMDWRHAVRGIAYFKELDRDRTVFDTIRRQRNIPVLPLIHVHADICRDDLLFELELDAQR